MSDPLADLQRRKARIAEIREIAADRIAAGDSGLHVASSIADAVWRFIDRLASEVVAAQTELAPEQVSEGFCVVAVGGTGRGEMAPYSDVDLMLLASPSLIGNLDPVVGPLVQAMWDADLKLGQSLRTVRDAIKLAQEDGKTATSFLQTRCLWGNPAIHDDFRDQFRRKVIGPDPAPFTETCVNSRRSEFTDANPASQVLEPNVKTSLGGLRDLHLLGWIAEAHHKTSDNSVLQLTYALSFDDARRLTEGHEFLTRVRTRLHLLTGGPQDLLTRDLQLRLAAEEDVEATASQRAVERLMQEYFRHSGAIAEIVDRFVNRHRPRPVWKALVEKFRERRVDGRFIVGPIRIDVSSDAAARTAVSSLDEILRVYQIASERGVLPSPRLSDGIKAVAVHGEEPGHELTERGAEMFREILDRGETLPKVLRHMASTHVLELVIPQWRRVAGLLQFNQYHHFTVDEHTLRAVRVVASFADQNSPLGTAYRNTPQKAVLHLAVMLHDIGKGCEEDHCLVGERMANEICPRLGFTESETRQVAALVRWHLEMADIAFRRDITDEGLLAEFGTKIGSPKTLAMLYLLTVADVTAVGPGTWSPWKGELLEALFRRAMVILSGRPYSGFEAEEIAHVRSAILAAAPADFGPPEEWAAYVETYLPNFSAYYLTRTPPAQIARDLSDLHSLAAGEVRATGFYDEATRTFEYRVLFHEATAPQAFHKLCGTLAARNVQILSADITTTHDGHVIDGFRVTDDEVDAATPSARRIAELCAQMRSVLLGEVDVEDLFHRYERFDIYLEDKGLPSGLTSRVRLDAETSDSRLIIDVFTQDRRGLLYVLAEALMDLKLDVDLAKIGTHFDQVIDVFYVTEQDGSKPSDPDFLQEIRETLSRRLEEFERDGFRAFRRTAPAI